MSDQFELGDFIKVDAVSNFKNIDIQSNIRNKILDNEKQNRRRYRHLLISQIIIVAFAVVLLVTIGVYLSGMVNYHTHNLQEWS